MRTKTSPAKTEVRLTVRQEAAGFVPAASCFLSAEERLDRSPKFFESPRVLDHLVEHRVG